MKYSPESLEAFVQTVASGSFSAAARALSKSQSTISNAIANLEDDLGFTLFDRSGRNPILTEHGQRAFAQVQQILAASQRLDELAVRLSQGVEPRLSLAISDFWQADHHENLLNRFEVRYPDIDFECMIAEDADALDLIQAGRVHLGVVRAQPQLPPDLAVARLQVGAQMAIYLHQDHALSQAQQVSEGQLGELRHLRLNTWVQNRDPLPAGRVWSAPSYLLLLEMAEQGFGWSILPRWLVEQFGHQVLKELPVPGWPQHIAVDVVWSRRNPPGPAGRWMIDQLCAQQPD
ncbi:MULTISPECIES: LysR family transcriptional regulator [unclassified Pantoea]|jgi:DNA-binding transcriptional LysR family regulator|uniref:LysR family transcriptional regulator n=1 Tax=unclassified Pantoea TaxID=2630326 RepID=UPI000D8531D5|nr:MULTISPECIES: LysR family transcriptional regulator [unclassified Pantoea]MBD9661478.1 LysR family transcriptional regulator [Pantoea sp. PNT03]MBY4886520.1 LysR family transcriptional regulator [Pantoea sp. DY-15]MBY4950247.1 LysR family transcriptional regulator [Pantoea sp. DY-17]PYG50966.1 DNA-binding transcriptional LysR family regulator [Pantoea sp. AG1095]